MYTSFSRFVSPLRRRNFQPCYIQINSTLAMQAVRVPTFVVVLASAASIFAIIVALAMCLWRRQSSERKAQRTLNISPNKRMSRENKLLNLSFNYN